MSNNAKGGSESPRVVTIRAVEESDARSLKTSGAVTVRSARRVRVGSAAREVSPGATVQVQLDELVRVEYQNGIALWMRADDLLRERGRKGAVRGDGGATWEIDTAPQLGVTRGEGATSTERGALGLGIKVLEFFGIDLAGRTAAFVGASFELQQLKLPAETEPGLFRVTLTPEGSMTRIADGSGAETLASAKPILVFLHGTMSRLKGSFGALWSTDDDDAGKAAQALRAALAVRYGQEVYGFEHRTLTHSPIRNALDLVRELPAQAQLHLVSHSRGGLVGEALCLAQRDRMDDPLQADRLDLLFSADRTVAEQLGLGSLQGDAAKARDAAYADDRKLLAELARLLDEKRIRVTRFVRVACPARGTTLASGRLDRWLSVINLLTGDGLIGDTADFLLAVVKERTDPRTLPGIEAMMPGSALTRLLHLPQLTTRADLSVIAGDVQGKGLWGQLKLLALDWFYGSDHDLVVNTGSMFGGIRRPDGAARFRRDAGDKVNHFRYFSNRASIDWLADALARDDGSDAGYTPIQEARHEEPRWRAAVRASRSVATPRPLALVVPGTMGSALNVRDRPVWLHYWALMKGGLDDMRIGEADVQPVDLLDDFYGPLLEHLTRTHKVEILPYDWRLSVQQAAKALTAKIEALLPEQERTRQPVHIVAHSMGGLVARAMIADGGAGAQAWQRLAQLPGSRLLMLGTPNLGSFEAVRWLIGMNPSQAKLILLDFTHSAHGIIDIVRQYPGLAELLPFDQDPNPWGLVSTWRKLKSEIGAGWSPIEDAVLRQAAATWKLLRAAQPDRDHMVYVAGCQPATVIGHEMVDLDVSFGRRKLQFIATSEGDGTVTWASGRLAEVPTYYAPDTGHDSLCSNSDDRRIFRGYVDLLQTGKTDQLPTSPPGRTRGAGAEPDRFVLPDQPVTDDLPDEASLRSIGFGSGRPRLRGEVRSSQIEVSICHGDLRYAKHAVLVGHYTGDPIVSSEAALDDQMRGAQAHGPLTHRNDLGLYPGAVGTHAVFFNEDPTRRPMGAIVVGLGQVGELSPGRLEAGVRDALLEYALRLVQRRAVLADCSGDGSGEASGSATPDGTAEHAGRCSAAVSCLLVGTGATSLLARDAIEAMVRAALAANRKLEDTQLDQKVLIDHIEFIELYEDIALGAAKDLSALLDSADIGSKLSWPARTIVRGEGRRHRLRFDPNPSWWQRLEITEDRKADRLRFVFTGDRARAEETLAVGQLRLADGFIAQACGSASSNADVSKTLFEMLLPNRLKESAPEQRSVVLLVDAASARFPWELLEDRWSHLGRPPAVTGGMVRQLKTSEFRARPAHPAENTVFVVGNPDLEGWSDFVDLPGARHEAERVRDLFGRSGYVVSEAIDKTADAIIGGLHGSAWRVLHLAGHGEHEFDVTEPIDSDPNKPDADTPIELPDGRLAKPLLRKKTVSGMVIGKQTFLTPGDVEQMRYVPELVFINCCHLGKTGTRAVRHNELAANLGVQFIRMGVRAVVCAGWAVDDRAAVTFAESFYARMLGGSDFGTAVHEARKAAWSAHPDANTWGAYQCYGDPGFRLTRDDRRPEDAALPDYVLPSELVVDLRNLAEATRMRSKDASVSDQSIIDRLRDRIDRMLQRVPLGVRNKEGDGWLGRADVSAELGFVYGEGRMFVEAAEWLDAALRSGAGDCPVRVAEQWANFQVRLAAQEWADLRRAAGETTASVRMQRAEIAERIERALSELDVINTRAPTSERLGLLGSACKRLAWVQEGQPRTEALLNMAAYYRTAWDAGKANDAYALTNWAIACLLLERIDVKYRNGDWHPALAELIQRQAGSALQGYQDKPSFWGATGLADLQVVQLLMAGDDRDRCEHLAKAAGARYAAAFARGASLREVASVQEHLDFLIDLTSDAPYPWPNAIRDALAAIRSAI